MFVVSWVNPDARLAQKSFEDYMLEGPLAALDAIEQATGEREVNVDRLLPRRHAARRDARPTWRRRSDDRVSSATFFVALLDFSIPGELGVFIDEEQVDEPREADERARLPRRLGDGRDLQHAARRTT